MPSAYQNVLALMVSVVIHLLVIGLLSRIALPSGQTPSTLQITVSPDKTEATSRVSQSTPSPLVPTQAELPQPSAEPETATVVQEENTNLTPSPQVAPRPLPHRTSPAQPSVNLPKIPDLGGLFQSRPSSIQDKISTAPPSTSTRGAPHPSLLSIFQPYLLNHISQKKYHDKQYPFSQLNAAREVILLITLQANGTLEKIKVLTSSGDSGLDEAAKRATIAASPFDRPPIADSRFGYTYQIPIRYVPN